MVSGVLVSTFRKEKKSCYLLPLKGDFALEGGMFFGNAKNGEKQASTGGGGPWRKGRLYGKKKKRMSPLRRKNWNGGLAAGYSAMTKGKEGHPTNTCSTEEKKVVYWKVYGRGGRRVEEKGEKEGGGTRW